MGARITRWLGLAVVASFATTLLLSIAAPLYTDEVGFKAQVTRVFEDGNAMVSLLPQCAKGHVLPVPLAWYPGVVVSTLLFRPLGLLGLKLSGVALVVAWFALAWVLLGEFGTGRQRTRRFGLFVAAHAFGVVPFTLVMARAEGTLLVCLLVYAGFALAGWFTKRASRGFRAGMFALFAVVTSLFFFSHSKTVLWAPVVVVATVLGFRKVHRAWLAAALAVVLFTAGSTYAQASRTARCDEVPYLNDVFGLLVLSPASARKDPAAFFTTGVEDVWKSAAAIVKDMTLTETFPSGWLPPMEDPTAGLPGYARAANLTTRFGLRAVEAAAVVASLAAMVLARRGRRAPVAWFSGALFFCLGGHLFFTKHWPFYHTPFAVPQLAVLAVFAGIATAPYVSRRLAARRAFALGEAAFVLAALVSSVATVVHLGPRLVALASHQGTLLAAQTASVPSLHYGAERVAIRAHAARCGIQGDGASKLVVDDATLFAFDDLYRPVHLIYVSDATMWGVYMPGEKNVAFLRDLGVSGMITRCAFLPTALAPKMVRDDRGYCCLGPEALTAP